LLPWKRGGVTIATDGGRRLAENGELPVNAMPGQPAGCSPVTCQSEGTIGAAILDLVQMAAIFVRYRDG